MQSEPSSDDARFAALFHVHYQSLVGLARLLDPSSDAEDVVQAAFVRVYRRGRLQDPDKAVAYLRKTILNLIRSHWRHRAAESRHAWVLPREATAAIDVEQRLAVRSALASLPRRQREAVVLRYFADMTEADAAVVMGVSEGSVKAYTSRGLQSLGKLIGSLT